MVEGDSYDPGGIEPRGFDRAPVRAQERLLVATTMSV